MVVLGVYLERKNLEIKGMEEEILVTESALANYEISNHKILSILNKYQGLMTLMPFH